MSAATGIVGEFQSLKAETDADLLAMQCGDFYEFFGDDAEIVGRELDLRLSEKSSNGKQYPMAGVPVNDLTPYLKSLVERGFRIAVADQYETDDGFAREIVRVVTPGTFLETSSDDATYIASVAHVYEQQRFGLALADVTTGQFLVTGIGGENAHTLVIDELYRFDPVEILFDPTVGEDDRIIDGVAHRTNANIVDHSADSFAPVAARRRLEDHFGSSGLEGIGLDERNQPEIMAAGAILSYVEETGVGVLSSMSRLQRYDRSDHATLDATTQRNLELVEAMGSDHGGTLFETIDHTVTSGGSRQLRAWLQRPMRAVEPIANRHNSVAGLVEAALGRETLRDILRDTYDLERLASRISHGSADAHALLQVRDTLSLVPAIIETLEAEPELASSPVASAPDRLDMETIDDLCDRLDESLHDDPPKNVTDGGLIKQGYDHDLDQLIARHDEARSWVEALPKREKRRLGVTHLRVDRNRTDGYYIQVGRSELERIPEEYTQIKELKNSIRFTTDDLSEREREILRLEEKRAELEYELFCDIRAMVSDHVEVLQDVGRMISRLDALVSLASHAATNRWTRPAVTEDGRIDIDGGRHPVVEQSVDFVPNDTELGGEHSFVLVTGPNMSGKSTYMRQVALIVLLAQIGSFVPANRAHIGLVDGIFTRVGAMDELARGRSTFMVEMHELSNILHSATAQSLIILDEVGRGTATYDGISIAWAATEYIHNQIGAKTLFATHYHELTVLAEHLDRVENIHVAADERDGEITFLRTIREGPTDRSYGIHVADLAGVPRPVIDRARDVLDRLRREKAIETRGGSGEPTQVVFDLGSGRLQRPDATADGGAVHQELDETTRTVLEELTEFELERTTPLDVMGTVERWQQLLNQVESDHE